MELDETIILEGEPTEPVEVLSIETTDEGHYVYLCVGEVIITPNIVLDHEKHVCSILHGKEKIEFPVADNARLDYF